MSHEKRLGELLDKQLQIEKEVAHIDVIHALRACMKSLGWSVH